MNWTVRIWPETPSRRRARAVLIHLVLTMPTDTFEDFDRKLPVLDAVCALDESLPAGWLLGPVDPEPGDVADAYRLLSAAIYEQYPDDTTGTGTWQDGVWAGDSPPGTGPGMRISARDIVATGIAASHLRPLIDPSPLHASTGASTGPSVDPGTLDEPGPAGGRG